MALCRMVAAIAALMGLTLTAATEPAQRNPFLEQIVEQLHRQGRSLVCFVRQYDDAHLAAHPGQQASYAKALIAAYYWESSLASVRDKYMYQVSLAFRFRNRPETLTGVAECGDGTPKDSLRHGAVCAGPGEQHGHLAMDGKNLLVLTVPGGADLWLPGRMEQRHDVAKNPFGPDDKVFRLVRTDLNQCEDLAFDSWKPLRP